MDVGYYKNSCLMSEIAPVVNAAARKKLLFLPHAVKQMSRPDRMISVQEVRRVVLRKQTNGIRGSESGGLHEMHALPRENEERSSAFSY